MAAYSLLVKRSAAEDIDNIARKRDRERIIGRIAALATEPRPRGCEKLGGTHSFYRVRQGPYRIVYTVDDGSGTVEVIAVGHRRNVYRQHR